MHITQQSQIESDHYGSLGLEFERNHDDSVTVCINYVADRRIESVYLTDSELALIALQVRDFKSRVHADIVRQNHQAARSMPDDLICSITTLDKTAGAA